MDKSKRKQKRDESLKSRVEREETRKSQCISVLATVDQAVESELAEANQTGNTYSSISSDNDDDDTIAFTAKRPRPRNVVNSQVAAALDRTKISDRNAVYALASFSQTVGQDTDALALNR